MIFTGGVSRENHKESKVKSIFTGGATLFLQSFPFSLSWSESGI